MRVFALLLALLPLISAFAPGLTPSAVVTSRSASVVMAVGKKGGANPALFATGISKEKAAAALKKKKEAEEAKKNKGSVLRPMSSGRDVSFGQQGQIKFPGFVQK